VIVIAVATWLPFAASLIKPQAADSCWILSCFPGEILADCQPSIRNIKAVSRQSKLHNILAIVGLRRITRMGLTESV
jgi:hypothetical protein